MILKKPTFYYSHKREAEADIVIECIAGMPVKRTGLKTVAYYCVKDRHDKERWLTIKEVEKISTEATILEIIES